MVRFWDTSALVPLIVAEPATPVAERLRSEDPGICVWWGSRVECRSAIARSVREGRLGVTAADQAQEDLTELWQVVAEVAPTEVIRVRAEQSLVAYPLRAADALQLAAALVWSGAQPGSTEFDSLDMRLRDAAASEGFTIMPGTVP